MTSPNEHAVESQKLEADAQVDLYQINFIPNGTIFFKDGKATTWRSALYESLGCQLTGVTNKADGQKSRPQLVVMNPDKVFSAFVALGKLEGSLVIRKRVLRTHLESNINIFDQRLWIIARVAGLVGPSITLELRNVTDGPNFLAPARAFIPPEFPSVSI